MELDLKGKPSTRANVRRLENELRRTRMELKQQKLKTAKLSSALKLNDVKYKSQQETMDGRLKTIISKFLFLEGEIRREQQEIEQALQAKGDMIDKQRQKISRLERMNVQLRGEVVRLREGEHLPRLDTTIRSARITQLETLNEETTC